MTTTPSPLSVPTEVGEARVHLRPVADPRGLLMLGHGAGGGVEAPDLRIATAVARDAGWTVALVDQPYRVAGRRAPAPARQLDRAWTDVARHLRAGPDAGPAGAADLAGPPRTADPAGPQPTADPTGPPLAADLTGLPLAVGGRSSGARVACRTAGEVGAVGVLCLAFPLQTPGRPDRSSRLPELDGVEVPVLVVQGERDRFGMPPAGPGRTVAVVPGDHSLRAGAAQIEAAVRDWLERLP